MSQERLSKLQKWILVNCYQSPNKGMARRHIMSFFNEKTRSVEVVASRSVWNLIEKGLVTGLSPLPLEVMAMVYGRRGKSMSEFKDDYKEVLESGKRERVAAPSIRRINKVKVITLTEKDEEEARKLLNVK